MWLQNYEQFKAGFTFIGVGRFRILGGGGGARLGGKV